MINFLTILLMVILISPPSILFWMGYIIATKDNFLFGLIIMIQMATYIITTLIEYQEFLNNNK